MSEKRERTLILLKPDAVQRGLVGKIIQRFEQKGKVIHPKCYKHSKKGAQQSHLGRKKWADILAYTSSKTELFFKKGF